MGSVTLGQTLHQQRRLGYLSAELGQGIETTGNLGGGGKRRIKVPLGGGGSRGDVPVKSGDGIVDGDIDGMSF